MEFERENRVQHFSGAWVQEGAEREGVRLALRALWDAVLRCPSVDMSHCTNVADALEYLATKTTRRACLSDFAKALAMADPVQRFQSARAAYEAICRRLGQLAAYR